MEYCRLILPVFMTLFLINFVSANFVCGEVTPTGDVSPSWMDVLVYYDESPNDVTFCEINSQNKFCCDLDDIDSVSWTPGKMVYAEVYDVMSGYVSDLVSLTTTEEAYDLFPTIGISKILDFENNISTVLVGEDSFTFDYVLNSKYPNLKVFLNNSNGSFEYDVCVNCSSGSFTLNFSSGTNDVRFLAYGDNEFYENMTFYVLDFLEVRPEFVCEDCTYRNGRYYVPAGSFVYLNLRIYSSDYFEGEISGIEYIPRDWILVGGDYFSDFTESHSFVRFNINSSNFTQRISLKSPSNFWQRKYIFRTSVGELDFEDDVYLYGFFWFGFPFYFDEPFLNTSYYQMSLNQYINPNRPLVVDVFHSNVDLIAIYPKRSGVFRGVVSVDEPFLFGSWSTFRILSNLNDGEVDRVIVKLIVPKGRSIELSQDDQLISLERYKEDSSNDYYTGTLYNLDEFRVREV